MAESAASAFEQIKHADEQDEFWLARALGKLLGYNKWQNFLGVIHEAMEVCRVQGGSTEGFFAAISKKPSGRGRPSAEYDYRLSRHACYLVAESADGRKEEVALAWRRSTSLSPPSGTSCWRRRRRSGCVSSIANACSVRMQTSRCAPVRPAP